jgi:hypothetical protein
MLRAENWVAKLIVFMEAISAAYLAAVIEVNPRASNNAFKHLRELNRHCSAPLDIPAQSLPHLSNGRAGGRVTVRVMGAQSI